MPNFGIWAPFSPLFERKSQLFMVHKEDHFVEFISVTVRDRCYLSTYYQKLSVQKNPQKLDEK